MLERQKWTDHQFHLGIDIGWTQNVLSRLEDAAVRIEQHCLNLNKIQLTEKIEDAWSIKEHIGHLTDLEELWIARFQEFHKKSKELVGADMSNQKTKASNHNQQSLDTLLNDFQTARKKLIEFYHTLNEESQQHQALHPRIKQLMRPVDLLFFIAEHDDHHITSIIEIKKYALHTTGKTI